MTQPKQLPTGAVAPPHDAQAERSVLGGILLMPEALRAAQEAGLAAEHFYLDKHMALFSALVSLTAAEQPIDSVTVRWWLVSEGRLDRAGGDEYLLALTDTIPTVSNIRAHAAIVVHKAALRRVKGCFMRGAAAAQAGELEDAHEAARQALEVKSEKRVVLYSPRQLIEAAEQSARSATRGIGGIKTGYQLLDEHIAHMDPGEVMTVGGRSGCGKSHLMLGLAVRAAWAGHRVGIVSCEDPKKRWGTRYAVLMEPGLTPAIMAKAQLNFEQLERLERAKRAGDKMQMRYADCYNEPLPVVLEALRAVLAAGCDLVVLDHLHAIQMRAGRGETTADVVCDAVRQIARETRSAGAVLVLGAQLGRPDKQKQFAEPTMFDFRDTSQIEISSDYMLLTWKPSDADGAPIYGKIGKLKDGSARPRFKLQFAENGALSDLAPHSESADDQPTNGGRKWT